MRQKNAAAYKDKTDAWIRQNYIAKQAVLIAKLPHRGNNILQRDVFIDAEAEINFDLTIQPVYRVPEDKDEEPWWEFPWGDLMTTWVNELHSVSDDVVQHFHWKYDQNRSVWYIELLGRSKITEPLLLQVPKSRRSWPVHCSTVAQRAFRNAYCIRWGYPEFLIYHDMFRRGGKQLSVVSMAQLYSTE
jgi:hypothetical protein